MFSKLGPRGLDFLGLSKELHVGKILRIKRQLHETSFHPDTMWLIRRRIFILQLLLLAVIIVFLTLFTEHYQLLYDKPDCIQTLTVNQDDPRLYL